MDHNPRPNILVVMSDDHGPWAYRAAGCSAAHTPAMDWLAETGCRFRHAFTPSAVCSPARACFFTGLIPSAHGIHDWIEERDTWDIDWLHGQRTLAQRLHGAGYDTALVGKWHCGRSHTPQPGFNHWFSYARAHQFPHFGEQSFVSEKGVTNGHGRQSRFLFDDARAWLRSRRGEQPFFLFYGPVDTHSPFSGHARALVSEMRSANFDDIPYEPGRVAPEHRVLGFPETATERQEHLANYLAAVSSIDEQLAGLIDTLDELGQLDNTLVLYTSDHGHMDGHHGLVGKGNGSIPQNFFDESIHVPCVVRWPSQIPAGSVLDAPVDHCDWFATLLGIGGADAGDQITPARSLAPLWQGRSEGWRDFQVCEYGNARMLRTSTRKLIIRNRAGLVRYPDEFYDLVSDPRETENRIEWPAYAAEITEMRARLDSFFKTWEIPEKSGWDVEHLPRFNPAEAWVVSPQQRSRS